MSDITNTKCFICDRTNVRLHGIPTPESGEKWLRALGLQEGEELENALVDVENILRICDKHFTIRAFTSPKKMRLIKNAVPSVNVTIGQAKKNALCKKGKQERQKERKKSMECLPDVEEPISPKNVILSIPKKSEQKKLVLVPIDGNSLSDKYELVEEIQTEHEIQEEEDEEEENKIAVEHLTSNSRSQVIEENDEIQVIISYEDDVTVEQQDDEIISAQLPIKQEQIKIESKYRCRLCLDYFESVISLLAISDSQQKTYIDMLKTFVRLRIDENADFENIICENCADNIQNAYSFLQLCLQSDEILFASENDDAQDHSYNKLPAVDESMLSQYEVDGNVLYVKHDDSEVIWQEEHDETNELDGNSTVDEQFENGKDKLCDLCGKSFTNSFAYKKHMKRHGQGDKTHQCSFCGKKFWKQNQLENHEALEHYQIQTLYQCDICEKLFINESKLDQHYKSHTTPQEKIGLECEQCGKICANKGTLTMHMKTHISHISEDGKTFMCDVCGEQVSNTTLSAHMKQHTEKKCLCDVCGAQVCTSNLTLHMQIHDPNRTRNYKCQYCSSTFFNKYNCKYHERVMHGTDNDESINIDDDLMSTEQSEKKRKRKPVPKKYVCNVCGARAPSQILLLNHLTLHDPTREKIRKYKCKYCDKRFTQGAHVKTHELLHTGDKPYKCEYCGKRFRHLTTINDHKRIHTGSTPYHCEICNRKFNSQTNFKKHMASHSYYLNKSIVKVETVEVEQVEMESTII